MGSRPFKGYADGDLQNLEAAYRAQVDGQKGLYHELATRRVTTRSGNDMLDKNIANFEHVQRKSDEKRAVAGVVAENQARLSEIQAEIAYRQYVTGGLSVHIKRLTTI